MSTSTILLLICLGTTAGYREYGEANSQWLGKWFPVGPGQKDDNPVIKTIPEIGMSTLDPSCDNGKFNLAVDWDGSPSDYTCFQSKHLFKPKVNVRPLLKCEHIPVEYSALHVCMNNSIEYDFSIPTFGMHRPLWARYGEYRYLPKQRWIHNLEHGAIVLLYHPCADIRQVNELKRLVRGCLYRHIITADSNLTEDRPLVMVSWGCSLAMSFVHPPLVESFIKERALTGPERLSRDGQFSVELLKRAEIVSDQSDTMLCPDTHQYY